MMNDLCLLSQDKADSPPETDGGQWLIGDVKQQDATHQAPPRVPF
jgi:hypothetical protein